MSSSEVADRCKSQAQSCILEMSSPLAWRQSVQSVLALRHSNPHSVRLSFEWLGSADFPVVLVVGGISASRHLAASEAFPEPGWWQDQVGPGLPLDTDRFRILSVDWIGADGTLDVPIDSSDQADALVAVLDYMGVGRIAAFVGCSYGAMVGLQFAARYPDRVNLLLAISGGDRAHPYSSAWRTVQRNIVRLGRNETNSRDALSLARQLGRLSYGTPEEFAERFPEPTTVVNGRARCASEDFLDSCGSAYVARTSLNAFLRLSESIDLHRVDPEEIRVATVLVAIEEDRLVPPDTLVELGQRLPALQELHLLSSPAGHDAFLHESQAIGDIIRATLAETPRAVA